MRVKILKSKNSGEFCVQTESGDESDYFAYDADPHVFQDDSGNIWAVTMTGPHATPIVERVTELEPVAFDVEEADFDAEIEETEDGDDEEDED